MRYYDIEVAGTKRALKLCPINQDLCIAAFLILGDTELTVNCAAALLERAPKYDFLLTAEAKSIPLVQEMARQNGDAHYIVARKGRKLYMDNPICVGVKSITTEKDQKLYVDQEEMEQMRGKRILIVDDVISTGRSPGFGRNCCRCGCRCCRQDGRFSRRRCCFQNRYFLSRKTSAL